MTRLRAVLSQLEGGVGRCRASTDGSGPATAPANAAALTKAVDAVEGGLRGALEAHQNGEREGRVLVEKTEYDHYRNSLLETAIRGELSQTRNFEYSWRLRDFLMMRSGGSREQGRSGGGRFGRQVAAGYLALTVSAPAEPGGANLRRGGVGDWTKVADELRRALDEAAAMHAQGDGARAAQAVKTRIRCFSSRPGPPSRAGTLAPKRRGPISAC